LSPATGDAASSAQDFDGASGAAPAAGLGASDMVKIDGYNQVNEDLN
jgi:hypothetical protein